ncbi:IS30 family transposase [Virgisporangium aliadipatigenens]|uniref:IS30 family transposase n=1 Tax=Virgisporangium aliadipatigenens TaxID=741659 RepID=A0A8J3YXQ7_9ACTN|nr:IS30 family transposase [Virgisporangium aliadipatigenens]
MAFMIRSDDERWPGHKGLPRERVAFFELLTQGWSVSEAAREVGVTLRTTQRWRFGRHERPALLTRAGYRRVVAAAASGRFLSEQERITIADRLRDKASIRTIAAELGRSPSTLSREIARNRSPVTGRYGPHLAQRLADNRRPRPKTGKIAGNPALRDYVQAKLDLKWSPQQICQAVRVDFPDRPDMHLCHETIYLAIYVQGRGELRRELHTALRTGRARRKPHRSPDARRPRFTHDMVMISDRPAEIEDRAVPGHWEGDLIMGRGNNSAIGTLVERATRYVMLLHLPHARDADTVRDAIIATIKTLPAHLARSLTWDQGPELAGHHQITLATNMAVYFCDPASPWQRGTNENTNGLLRQYFPKGTDLSIHTAQHLTTVATELNGRPRKTLDWDTPAQRLTKLLNIN